MHSHKSLLEIHEDVPADHYDKGIKKNPFQKFWHWRRFTEVLKLVEPVDGPILDLGCHSGTFTSRILSKTGSQDIYGVDVSHSAITTIKKRFPKGHFEVADAAKLPYKANMFDALFCLEMLEHVDDPMAVIGEMKRVLKKNGYGMILVPNDNRLFKTVWFLWTMYYSVWRHAHVQSFRNDDLGRILADFGFKVEVDKTFNSGMLKLVKFRKI